MFFAPAPSTGSGQALKGEHQKIRHPSGLGAMRIFSY